MTVIENQPEQLLRDSWRGVEIRHLATLSMVARTGSFRQAARSLGYVQSAVSQQVAQLERAVGARLVERQRGQRTIRLTPAGELLSIRGDRILSQLHAAQSHLSAGDEVTGGDVRLAVAHDIAPVLARFLAHTRAELPDLPIRVTEVSDDDELVGLLEAGAADVVIGVSTPPGGLAGATLLHDPFVLLAPAGSAIARMGTVSRSTQLAGERLIVPAAAVARAAIRAPGPILDRALHVPLAAAVAPLVSHGMGIGLVPRSSVEGTAEGLAVVPTSGLIAPQRVMLVWHPARGDTTRIETLCDTAVRGFLESEFAAAGRAA
jgi:molybdate transport repressor ModE-like protein